MPKTEQEKIEAILKILEKWPEDCPNKPTLMQALLDPNILHSKDLLEDPGIATLTSALGTVELYHLERPPELLPTKLEESEIPGRHGDIFHYRADKSDRLELRGLVDAESEYTAIKSTLKTMRQGQDTNPISVTVRCGTIAYINGVQYWVGDIEIEPEPGFGIFWMNYSIKLTKRD